MSQNTRKRKKYGRMKEVIKKLRLASHEIGPECFCKSLMYFNTVNAFINLFNAMKIYNEQNSYLNGLIILILIKNNRLETMTLYNSTLVIQCGFKEMPHLL